jgi:hypothetical protein
LELLANRAQRFLYIRALLLRPVLLVASHHCGELNISNSSRTPSLQIDVMIRICAHCISTVTTLVDLKYRGLQDLYSGPPWNTVHCTSPVISDFEKSESADDAPVRHFRRSDRHCRSSAVPHR